MQRWCPDCFSVTNYFPDSKNHICTLCDYNSGFSSTKPLTEIQQINSSIAHRALVIDSLERHMRVLKKQNLYDCDRLEKLLSSQKKSRRHQNPTEEPA